MNSLINCSQVIVKQTTTKGLGAFAGRKFFENELIENGLMKRVNTDGHHNPFLFTWSENKDVWAYSSGCATFYNTSLEPNCKVKRYYDEDRFEIYALNNINEGDELTHTYQSLQWRECFKDLYNNINK